MEWYEYNEQERIKNVFSKYSLKSFWDWWTNDEYRVMEVRIQNWQIIKETAEKFNLPYSTSGVYVDNDIKLKNVISTLRNKEVMWFGINPRKKNYNVRGWKSYGSGNKGGSSDHNVEEIGYLFIDIDRKIKQGPATNNELKDCDELSNAILDKLSTEKWNKGFCKICSGNGIQLLIKLDIFIKIPDLLFDNDKKLFLHNVDFEKLKDIIREGIGKQIIKFTTKYIKENDLTCEVDKSCLRIGGVGALPVTKNYKYDSFTWRGIVDLKNEQNDGFSDYILSAETNKEYYKNKQIFNPSKSLRISDRLFKGRLREHPVVKLMLDSKLPYGEINNKLWFQLKCLLRDCKIDLQSDEFRSIHKELEKTYNGNFSLNLPTNNFKFDRNIINSFCINLLIPPIYNLWPNRNKYTNFNIKNLDWDGVDIIRDIVKLEPDKTIWEDLEVLRDILISGDNRNIRKINGFTCSLISKYNKDVAKYYYKYVIPRYVEYTS